MSSYLTRYTGSKLALLHRVKERKTPTMSAQASFAPFSLKVAWSWKRLIGITCISFLRTCPDLSHCVFEDSYPLLNYCPHLPGPTCQGYSPRQVLTSYFLNKIMCRIDSNSFHKDFHVIDVMFSSQSREKTHPPSNCPYKVLSLKFKRPFLCIKLKKIKHSLLQILLCAVIWQYSRYPFST